MTVSPQDELVLESAPAVQAISMNNNSDLDEEDVDQLDSDSEEDASKSGKTGGDRIPGQTILPIPRLENIMQADGVTGNLSMSKEAQFVLSIATEEFIKRLAQAGERQASVNRRSAIGYRDMASSTIQYQEFMFLQDTIPHPISLFDALARREAKENEILADDPAISTPAPDPSIYTTGGSHSHSSRSKGKAKLPNGKEKQNGSADASTSGRRDSSRNMERERDRDRLGRWSQVNGDGGGDTPGSCDWSESASAGVRLGPDIALLPAEGDARDPQARDHARTHQDVAFEERVPAPMLTAQDEGWPGQFTGPASAFLQDPRAPFGRTQNPGRTIYSQHQPVEPQPRPSR